MHRSFVTVLALSTLLTAAPALAQTGNTPATVPEITTPTGCAPQAASTPPAATIRVRNGQEQKKYLYGTNDGIVLTAGSGQGLAVGQEFFVRRVVPDRYAVPMSGGTMPVSIHTAGWIRVVDVQ